MIAVVPLVGTWIETNFNYRPGSSPQVVPLVGTWIETHQNRKLSIFQIVVPLVGTWIETIEEHKCFVAGRSFPSWERGLKRS